jgi:hypothetical protein
MADFFPRTASLTTSAPNEEGEEGLAEKISSRSARYGRELAGGGSRGDGRRGKGEHGHLGEVNWMDRGGGTMQLRQQCRWNSGESAAVT